MEYRSTAGLRISVGRNNTQNDQLTCKQAGKGDWWFHTKDIHGSHVIICADGREISDTAIMEAASLAAYHSKAQNSAKVPVDFTLVKHVSKPNGAKPGMVIYVNNRTVYVDPKEKIGN
jgi:predicted ribosome quality control (RQC) complex YloA/Tae2 family protein